MSTELVTKQSVSYLMQLLDRTRGEQPVISPFWLTQLRDRAEAWTRELAIPTTRDEDWRFTDLSPLLAFDFQSSEAIELPEHTVIELTLPETQATRLVFVNGIFSSARSSVNGLPEGAIVGNLKDDRLVEIHRYLGQQAGSQEVFTALNAASLTDAAIVSIPKGTIVETPIQLLFVSVPQETPTIVQPRCLIVAEANSSVTFVQQFISTTIGCPDAGVRPYLTNAVTEIFLGDNAEVNHTYLQREGGAAFHIAKTAVSQAKDSRYSCHGVSLGSKLSRHNLEVFQTGEGTKTTLNGLALISGEQTADTHSAIVLEHPHGSADQLHKCIVDGKAHAVFNGRIFVTQTAQLTNANQLNRNLLLSPKGRVNTKPQLEIIADNVKCSHGATVSQLEADEVFYLQSRGLDKTKSENLLVDAFAFDILQRLPIPSLRKMLSQCVSCRTHIA